LAYITNLANNTITIYSVNTDGTLTETGQTVATGDRPFGIAFNTYYTAPPPAPSAAPTPAPVKIPSEPVLYFGVSNITIL
jgi:hypothetical protein